MAEIIERVAALETKVDNLEEDVDCLSNIEKSIERMTTLLEVEGQKGEKRDKLIEQQSNTLTQQNITLVKVNDSLKNLNDEIKNTNKRIDTLEKIVTIDAQKNIIDIREINKEKVKLTLGQKAKKAIVPTGALAGIVVFIYEVVKNIKIGQ